MDSSCLENRLSSIFWSVSAVACAVGVQLAAVGSTAHGVACQKKTVNSPYSCFHLCIAVFCEPFTVGLQSECGKKKCTREAIRCRVHLFFGHSTCISDGLHYQRPKTPSWLALHYRLPVLFHGDNQ